MERNPLVPILERAWKQGFSLQSQFFRDNSHLVGMAASQGLITTATPSGQFCGVWRITPEGCYDLFYNEAQEQHNELHLTNMETGQLPESP